MIENVQKKIVELSLNDNLKRVCFFYKKLLKGISYLVFKVIFINRLFILDVLTHLAANIHLEQFCQVLPQRSTKTIDDDVIQNNDAQNDSILDEIYTYDLYITICRETMHANQIKKLITTTGQQLLCTLNL